MSFFGRGLTRPWAQSRPSRPLLPLNPHINNHTRITTTSHACLSSSPPLLTSATMASKPPPPQAPHIQSITPLASSTAKWIELNQITYMDQTGRSRLWEVASRKTRGAAGVDAVAIGTIIMHPSRPPSTMLVLQYRPPVDATTVEWPAGLVDATETPEQAAVRELREETGYEGTVFDVSPTIASDPGMTTANMQLVMVQVELQEGDEELPVQKLDEGEYIKRVVVPLEDLYETLVIYSNQEGVVVSAKLWHWAAGLNFAAQVAKGM